MDPALNPYAPGAGTKPPVIAGRDDLVNTARIALARTKAGRHGKSFIAVGLRGVGKTVVLNQISELAEQDDYYVIFLEAHESATLAELLIPQLRRVLLRISRSAAAADFAKKGLRILRNFANAFKVTVNEVEFGMNFEDEIGTADSGNLTNDLPELLQVVGLAAQERGTALAILMDEMQYLASEEMSALVMAVHRINQRGLPVVLVGAGLPQLLAKMGDSKSYAERLFDFPRVEALQELDAKIAISEPAKAAGATVTDGAFKEVFRVTKGYPYFLQEWGYVA